MISEGSISGKFSAASINRSRNLMGSSGLSIFPILSMLNSGNRIGRFLMKFRKFCLICRGSCLPGNSIMCRATPTPSIKTPLAFPVPSIKTPRILPAPSTTPSRTLPEPSTTPSRILPVPSTTPSRTLPAPSTTPSRILPAPSTTPSRILPAPFLTGPITKSGFRYTSCELLPTMYEIADTAPIRRELTTPAPV